MKISWKSNISDNNCWKFVLTLTTSSHTVPLPDPGAPKTNTTSFNLGFDTTERTNAGETVTIFERNNACFEQESAILQAKPDIIEREWHGECTRAMNMWTKE